jgi:two-component system, NtrC family, response regulator HydG
MTDASATVPRQFRGRAEDSEFQLVAISGPQGSFEFSLDAGCPPRVLLGQGPLCGLRVQDPAVSRRHAAIELRGTHLVVTDLGSTNGTFVNGVAVLSAQLWGGEVLRVGETKLRVLASSVAASVGIPRETSFGRVVGGSVEMRRVFAIAQRLAPLDVPVLVEGEPGTGKRLLAESIHEASARRTGPLVVMDTAGVDPARLQTILFGSGRAELGLLEEAELGTLVIEEIATLDAPSQTRLLRAIEQGEIRRKGGSASPLDVRIIACTRRDLDREAEAGRFREDLLQRLAAGRLELPPLRRRDGDLPLLIESIWSMLHGPPDGVPHYLADEMADHAWPGNVRELESVLVRSLVAHDEPPSLARAGGASSPVSEDWVDAILSLDLPLPRSRERVVLEFEKRYLARALAKHGGNVVRAAAASGVARRYFQLLRAKRREP